MNYIGIDPSTKTGLVILDRDGTVLLNEEITFKGDDPERMSKIIETVKQEVLAIGESKVIIEDFAYAQAHRMALMGGIGWGIRLALFHEEISYIDVGTGQLKKFTGAKGNAAKDKVRLEVYKRWGYEHDSDNVIDAYVLAQIGRYLDGHAEPTKFQSEVLNKLRGE